jgi:hypothetical protein
VGPLEMQKAMPLDRQPTPPWWCSLLDGFNQIDGTNHFSAKIFIPGALFFRQNALCHLFPS